MHDLGEEVCSIYHQSGCNSCARPRVILAYARVHIQAVQRGLLEHPAASRVFRSASERVVVTVTRPETWRCAKDCKYRHSLGFVCHSAGEINTKHNKHYGVLELAHVYVGDTGHICMMKESSLWRVIVVAQMHQMAAATVPVVSIKGLI